MKTDFEIEIMKSILIADGELDAWIMETEAELKRDLTIEEENAHIKEWLEECKNWECKGNLYDAYMDIMH